MRQKELNNKNLRRNISKNLTPVLKIISINLMALNPEFRGRPQIPHTNLRSEATLKRLLKEGRYPSILVHDGNRQMENAECLIPGGNSKPPERFTVSLEDAKEIAQIRDRLQRQH